jgi:tetratricopeptide (TPR) repeat protein
VKIHPSDLLLEEVLLSPLDEQDLLMRHLSTCASCRFRLCRLSTSSRPEDMAPASEPRPSPTRATRRNGLTVQPPLGRVLRLPNSSDYSAVIQRSEQKYRERSRALQEERSGAAGLLDDLLAYEPQKRPLLLANSQRFQTWGLYELVLDRSWQVRGSNPKRSEELASLALAISARLDRSYYGSELIEDFRARAWSYIGNLRRIASDLEGSERAFETCYNHLKLGTREPLERAMFLDLKASLRRAQRRFEDAGRMLKRAITIFLRQGDQHRAGKSLFSLSVLHDTTGQPEQAIIVLQEALPLIDPGQDEHLLFGAWHNLIWYHTSVGRYIEAQGLYRKARAIYDKYEASGYLNRRLWVKGRIERGLGQRESAEVLLLAARKGFLEADSAYEAAVVSMELATLYAEQERTAELKQLATEILPIFASRHIHREALAAVMFLKQAVEAERLSIDAVVRVADFLRSAQADPNLKFEVPL